ncbi:cytotoxic and regulatory T-cell molecule [Melozone crissalis]|uniref:cytotoxic and regulatory T-cell molecule n=1 Tax=Melozone crissalis TaxID=40204 RepID=UPI0023D9DE7B|nr:cytotoxic and regulatory T-cell molecule [Melozone crissalis]
MSVPGALLAVPLLLLQGTFAGAASDSVALKEGENLNLNCTFSTLSNHNFTLQWLNPRNFTIFLNAQQVLRDRRYKLLRYSRDELSIQLSNLTLQDEGIYRCLHYTRHVRARSQNVQILAPPSHPVLEISQDEERGIKLSCHTRGGRPQPQISWLLDNGIELPGDTRHELGADGSSWSSRSTLRVLSYSPGVTVTASCAIGHPALGARRLLAPVTFQNLPSPGCKEASRPPEDGEVPSSSESPEVSSSPGNPAGTNPSASPENPEPSSPSASPKQPEVPSPSASPENPETSSPSASPKEPEVPSPSASPENTEVSSSPSASPNDPGVSSPSVSPENPELSSPSASPENPELSSPSASPENPEFSSPSASPKNPDISSPSASPENPEFSSPSASPKDPKVSIPSASPNDPGVSNLSASPENPEASIPSASPNLTARSSVTEQNPESKGLLRKEKNLLLPMLVAALVLVLLIIVLLFVVKLKKAHGVWKRENDVSEQTLESYKSRSNEESPGHEKNGQAGNPKSNMQYVTEEHVETPEKNLETPEKNPERPEKNPGDKSTAINEEIFTCGRETDV